MGAGLDAAGECHLGDVRVRDQRLTRLRPEAGDDVNDALGDARFLDQLDEFERRGRRELARLNNHRVAGGQGGSQLPCRQQQGRVPRDDGNDDAERLVHRVGEMLRLVDRQHLALDLVGEATIIIVPLRRVLELQRHLGDQLAVVLDLNLGQVLGVVGDQIAELAQQVPALRRRQATPFRRVECGLGCRHSAVRVLGPTARHQRPRLAGKWVEGLEPFARGGVAPLAADVHFQFFELGHFVLPAGAGRPMMTLTGRVPS